MIGNDCDLHIAEALAATDPSNAQYQRGLPLSSHALKPYRDYVPGVDDTQKRPVELVPDSNTHTSVSIKRPHIGMSARWQVGSLGVWGYMADQRQKAPLAPR